MNTIQVHILIKGTVQGVFFRQSTREKAQQLGLIGWVKNLPNGQVEVSAAGEKNKIDQLVLWCRTGPPMAIVDQITVLKQPVSLSSDAFEVIG